MILKIFLNFSDLKLNKYYRYIPLTVVIICFCYFYLYRYVYIANKRFKESEIYETIISSSNWPGSAIDYYLESGQSIQIAVGDTQLQIGDSISKPVNTNAFDVYRKNKNGKYGFFKHYDNE